jgi:ADP-glucose pyrophosphorylase
MVCSVDHLGRHVTVDEGAVVRRSVVLDGAVVRAGAEVVDAIVDVGVVIDAAKVGERYESGIAVYAPGAPVRP